MKQTLISQIYDQTLPPHHTEYRFDTFRRWRFDMAWPMHKVALEIEGGVWTGGRHTRGKGFLNDVEKYNAATLAGWRVLRCTPTTVTHKETIAMVSQLLFGPKIQDLQQRQALSV